MNNTVFENTRATVDVRKIIICTKMSEKIVK